MSGTARAKSAPIPLNQTSITLRLTRANRSRIDNSLLLETEENMKFKTLEVFFQPREDGGLRAWCPDLPLFVLSHCDPKKVLEDVVPVLETMLSAQEKCNVRISGVEIPSPGWAKMMESAPMPKRLYSAECFAN